MVITRERQKKHAKKLAENSIEFDSSSFNVAKLGIAMVTTRLAEVAQGVQQANILRKDAIRRQSEGEHVEKWELYPHVNYREMDGLASAAARFQEIGMRALGTDIQKHEITGADGNPIEMTSTSIITELNRDDPERLAMLILALRETGLAENMFSDDEIIDGVLLPMEGDEVAPPHVREDNNDDTNDNN